MGDSKERSLKESFKRFADNTSMHGFLDVYYAKSWFWIIFWTIAIFGSFAMTAYQIIQAVDQFIHQSGTTVIAAAQKEELVFPPIRLCFVHWIYWVDWKKAIALNFTKESVIFAMSYFTHGFSSTVFDLNQAKNEYLQSLHLNNLSTLSEFYSAVARDPPLSKDDKFVQYFQKTEIVFKLPNILFCYIIPETKMYEIILEQNSGSSITDGIELKFSVVDVDYKQMKEYITVEEYSHHIALWLNSYSVHQLGADQFHKDLTSFVLPMYLFPNGFSKDSVQIFSDNDEYVVRFSVSAHRWKYSATSPCVTKMKSVFPNDTCFYTCTSKFITSSCKCPFIDSAAFLGQDLPQNLCSYEIHFISQTEKNEHNKIEESWFQEMNPNCSSDFGEPLKQKCLNNCDIPCETWFYTMGIAVRSMPNSIRFFSNKTVTSVLINYPVSGEIFIATDIDTQTWENFIGNVGGLFGIWTGASILSIIQMLYYFSFCFKSRSPQKIIPPKNSASKIEVK